LAGDGHRPAASRARAVVRRAEMFLAQIIANGILLGGLYGLMALGMALVWGVLNIVNLAHGSFIMLGGYAAYYLFAAAGIDPFLALPLAMLIMFVFGYCVQRYIINFIVNSALLNTLLITFGLNVVLTYLAQLAFSADFRTINPSYAGANIAVAGITLPLARLAAFVIAIALALALWWLLNATRLGRSIRATSQNLVAARLYGVDPRSLYAITFGIGAALAGAAGGLYGVISQITPYIGASLTAKSFVIAIIGGLNNPLKVILGGVVIGIAESLGAVAFGPTYSDVISFGLLVVVLVVRPAKSLRAA
jgi:branched-chain amino acid transport system permease protein